MFFVKEIPKAYLVHDMNQKVHYLSKTSCVGFKLQMVAVSNLHTLFMTKAS